MACACVLIGLGLAMVVAAAPSPAAVSCTRYASPSGADTAAGTLSAPYRTAQKLVNTLNPGETGCLRAGTYSQSQLRFSRSGSDGAPITLASYPGERATIAGGYVYVPNGSNHVTLTELDIDGAAHAGPSIQIMAADTHLQANLITNRNIGESCVILGSLAGYGQAQRTQIRANRFADCGNRANGLHDHGIYVENSIDAQIVDNLFWNAAAWAIQLYPNAQRTLIAHNVIDANSGGIIVAGESAGGEYSQSYASTSTTIEYNVLSNASIEYNLQSWWGGPTGTNNLAHDNCAYNGRKGNFDTSTGGLTYTANTVANPLYQNPTGRDYRLSPDSPCLTIVGYDTAAKLAGTTTTPTEPTPTPADATPGGTPDATRPAGGERRRRCARRDRGRRSHRRRRCMRSGRRRGVLIAKVLTERAGGIHSKSSGRSVRSRTARSYSVKVPMSYHSASLR